MTKRGNKPIRCEKFNISVAGGTTKKIEPYIEKGLFRSRSHFMDVAATKLFIALKKRRST